MANQAVPDVSVIIPAHNALPYLHRSVQSLVDQTLDASRMEVVIVDDGSTDGTGEAVDEWARRHPDLFRVVHSPASGGPATPRNTALDLVRGRYVYFLDADDYLGEEALERLLTVADENQSDIVLGKMVQTGDRRVPQSMYRHNDLDADLFTSRVYWTLAVLKLFRRSLIEDNALRFPVGLPNGSDQPFAALAYLRAAKISVLSDYDFYHVVLRDDGKHVTRSGTGATHLDLHETMCALLAAEVPDPEQRAMLMTRHFQVDLRGSLVKLGREPAGEREALFERIAALVHEHLTPTVRARLTPDMRVIYHFVAEGLMDEAVQAAEELVFREYDVLLEGGRAYAGLPYFRDPEHALPDELFDITDRMRIGVELDSLTCTNGRVSLSGTAAFRRTVATPPEGALVLRRRGADSAEHVVSARVSDDGRFEVALDLGPTAEGDIPAKGAWEAHFRLSGGGVVRTRPLILTDAAQTDGDEGWLIWGPAGGKPRFSLVRVNARHHLRIDTGLTRAERLRQFEGWSTTPDGDDLVVTARLQHILDAPAEFLLRHADGQTRVVPTHHEGRVITGRIPVFDLADGRWSLRLRIGTPPGHWGLPVPAADVEPMVRKQGLGRTEVVAVAGDDAAFDVTSVGPRGRLTEKIRGLSGR